MISSPVLVRGESVSQVVDLEVHSPKSCHELSHCSDVGQRVLNSLGAQSFEIHHKGKG